MLELKVNVNCEGYVRLEAETQEEAEAKLRRRGIEWLIANMYKKVNHIDILKSKEVRPIKNDLTRYHVNLKMEVELEADISAPSMTVLLQDAYKMSSYEISRHIKQGKSKVKKVELLQMTR